MGEETEPDLVLHQFLYSHFNEKARWALDFKGVPHQRRPYLPGPHRPAMQKLSGQGQTPVLTIGAEVISGSARIIDSLETRYPEPALYPVDPSARTEALALQKRFDEEVGPAVRTALFSVLIDEGGYLTRMFARDASAPVRMLYRGNLPTGAGYDREGQRRNGPGQRSMVIRTYRGGPCRGGRADGRNRLPGG